MPKTNRVHWEDNVVMQRIEWTREKWREAQHKGGKIWTGWIERRGWTEIGSIWMFLWGSLILTALRCRRLQRPLLLILVTELYK